MFVSKGAYIRGGLIFEILRYDEWQEYSHLLGIR